MTIFGFPIAQILGIEYALAFVGLLWAALTITKHFGWRTTFQRWALGRRVIYFMTAMALLYLGIERFERHYPVDWSELGANTVILLYIVVFPVLRALDIISQDFLIGFQNLRRDRVPPRNARDGG